MEAIDADGKILRSSHQHQFFRRIRYRYAHNLGRLEQAKKIVQGYCCGKVEGSDSPAAEIIEIDACRSALEVDGERQVAAGRWCIGFDGRAYDREAGKIAHQKEGAFGLLDLDRAHRNKAINIGREALFDARYIAFDDDLAKIGFVEHDDNLAGAEILLRYDGQGEVAGAHIGGIDLFGDAVEVGDRDRLAELILPDLRQIRYRDSDGTLHRQ